MSITIESLGLSHEEIKDLLVEHLAGNMLKQYVTDENGRDNEMPAAFTKAMESAVRAKIDKAIEDIAGRNVLPHVGSYIEGFCLQQTTKWGETVGKKMSFTEYLISRAESYITEDVNYEGKAKDNNSYSWSKASTRIVYLINKHLQYEIERAMKSALEGANKAIVGGIESAVKIKLQDIVSSLKVDVKTK